MIKKHLKLLIITSIIILLPIVVGLLLWNQLPEQLPTHWDAHGQVDGWSSKPMAVFGLPCILVAAQWLCALGTAADPKKKNHADKLLQLVLWIIPLLSVLVQTLAFLTALGTAVKMELIFPLIFGLLFVIIGNYMPKCKQNYTLGIKLPWTLNSEENWNKTHRFAGILWVVGGVIIMATAFLGSIWFFLGITMAMVITPTVYSFILHQRGV